jgi:hypothetical protein
MNSKKYYKKDIYSKSYFPSLKGAIGGFLIGNILSIPIILRYLQNGWDDSSPYLLHTNLGIVIILFGIILGIILGCLGKNGGKSLDFLFPAIILICILISIIGLPLLDVIISNFNPDIWSNSTTLLFFTWLIVTMFSIIIIAFLIPIFTFSRFLKILNYSFSVGVVISSIIISLDAFLIMLISFNDFLISFLIGITSLIIFLEIEHKERNLVIELTKSFFVQGGKELDVSKIKNISRGRIINFIDYPNLVEDLKKSLPGFRFVSGNYFISFRSNINYNGEPINKQNKKDITIERGELIYKTSHSQNLEGEKKEKGISSSFGILLILLIPSLFTAIAISDMFWVFTSPNSYNLIRKLIIFLLGIISGLTFLNALFFDPIWTIQRWDISKKTSLAIYETGIVLPSQKIGKRKIHPFFLSYEWIETIRINDPWEEIERLPDYPFSIFFVTIDGDSYDFSLDLLSNLIDSDDYWNEIRRIYDLLAFLKKILESGQRTVKKAEFEQILVKSYNYEKLE